MRKVPYLSCTPMVRCSWSCCLCWSLLDAMALLPTVQDWLEPSQVPEYRRRGVATTPWLRARPQAPSRSFRTTPWTC